MMNCSHIWLAFSGFQSKEFSRVWMEWYKLLKPGKYSFLMSTLLCIPNASYIQKNPKILSLVSRTQIIIRTLLADIFIPVWFYLLYTFWITVIRMISYHSVFYFNTTKNASALFPWGEKKNKSLVLESLNVQINIYNLQKKPSSR